MFRMFVVSCVICVDLMTSAGAQDFPPLVRQPVIDTRVPDKNPRIRLIRGARIRYAPGQPTGLHRHPVSVIGIVTEGRFAFQPEGEPRRFLSKGDSFFEPAGKVILHFDNASLTHSATLVAYYLTDSEQRPLIELLRK